MAPPPVVNNRPAPSGSRNGPQASRQGPSRSQNYQPFRSKERAANKEKTQDLVCRVRYSNTLPEIPFDPKFLTCPFVDLSRFVPYKQTSLEKNYKHELLTEADLGVKIDLINPETYAIDYTSEIKMDPMDEKLLEEDQVNLQDQKRSKQHSRIVPWMRKTEYISSEYNRYGTTSERQETKFVLFKDRVGYNIKKLFKEENVYRDRESQIAAIAQTFDAAKQPVRQHYSKKGVVALEELPVLPDHDLWRFPFAQVIFDSDPSPINTVPSLQAEKMSQALIRGMMDESGEQFVAYFLPTEETLDKRRLAAAGSTVYTPEDQFDYKLSREYNWTVKNKASKGYEENYFLVFRGGSVFYNELETRVRLSRRRAKEGQPKIANSRLVVTHRDFDEGEMGAQEERLMQLQHTQEVEEEDEDGAEEGQQEQGKEEEEEGESKAEKSSDDNQNKDQENTEEGTDEKGNDENSSRKRKASGSGESSDEGPSAKRKTSDSSDMDSD